MQITWPGALHTPYPQASFTSRASLPLGEPLRPPREEGRGSSGLCSRGTLGVPPLFPLRRADLPGLRCLVSPEPLPRRVSPWGVEPGGLVQARRSRDVLWLSTRSGTCAPLTRCARSWRTCFGKAPMFPRPSRSSVAPVVGMSLSGAPTRTGPTRWMRSAGSWPTLIPARCRWARSRSSAPSTCTARSGPTSRT